jgi:type IV secretion system protein VirD4
LHGVSALDHAPASHGLIKPGAGRRAALVLGTTLGSGLAANIAATQFVAWRLSFHPALGQPWIGTLYAPWSWWTWMHTPWASRVPQTFLALKFGGLTLLALLGGGAVALATRAQRPRRHGDVHGSARFAEREAEPRESGLLPPKDDDFWPGVYVGAWRRKNDVLLYLRHGGPEHVMCLGPLRSGKGVAGVMPTLLSWPYSAVVYDEKGELWEFTSGWRGAPDGGKTRVLRWEPGGSGNTISWNPLAEIQLGTAFEYREASRIAEMIADPDGKGLEGHWDPNAASLLTGVILYAAYMFRERGRVASLADVAEALGGPAQSPDHLYARMARNHYGRAASAHRQIASEAQKQINRDQRERSGIHSTAVRMIRLYTDQVVAANTSRSDFRLLDLMNAETPTTLYVVTKAADKLTLRPLVRLFFTMAMNALTSVEMKKDTVGNPISPHKHRMLMLIDEFASLGKLTTFQDAMSKCAGYGIKCYLLAQDREQILDAYGPHESITSHCAVKSLYAPTNLKTQEWISDLLGASTVEVEAITESGPRGSAMRNISRTYHSVARPLLTSEEVGRLRGPTKKGDMIVESGQVLVLVASRRPILGEQALYFRDPVFQRRAGREPILMPSPCPVPPAISQADDDSQVSDAAKEAVEDTPQRPSETPSQGSGLSEPAVTHEVTRDANAPASDPSKPLPDAVRRKMLAARFFEQHASTLEPMRANATGIGR